MYKGAKSTVAIFASTALMASPVLAKSANDLKDLIGVKGVGGEAVLAERGFEHAGTHKDATTSYSFWWNAGSKNCVKIATYDGRYSDISDVPNTDCGHEAKDNTGAIVAAVAGVALIAALLASKKDKKDRGYSREEEQEYDRGFRDGWNKAGNHNYGNSRAYSDGYDDGLARRNDNAGSGRSDHGSPSWRYSNLRGERASSADSQLRSHGYSDVDSYKSGSTAYSIWYRRSNSQCLQMASRDGKVSTISEIRNNPKCRSFQGGHGSGGSAQSDGQTWFQRLVGAAGAGAEVQMRNQGFRKVDTFSSGRNASGSVWYNSSKRQCLQLITADGRVNSASNIHTHPKCR